MQKLKELVKNRTLKCIQLTEQVKKLTVKVDRQQNQISRLTDKAMEQNDTIERLQGKLSDLGHLERYFGKERVQSIVEQSKAIEQAERAERAEMEVRENVGTIDKRAWRLSCPVVCCGKSGRKVI